MKINFLDLPEPGDRYQFGGIFGTGVFGKVFAATDKQASDKKVAIKLQKYEDDTKDCIEEEYRILRDLSTHLNIIDFYGIYKKNNEIWLVLEPCDGGTAIDLVKKLLSKNRRMSEDHISYILKEVMRAVIYLHDNKVIHRDIKGSNILLTKEGEVKLCDFGLSQRKNKDGCVCCIGSPYWMAPELAESNYSPDQNYDNRVDVWSIGITAIELGEGTAPYEEMHPSRALFQIIRNPPPCLKKLSHWSQNYHDFISETLIKNFEHRAYAVELIEHPLLEQVPENNYHLSLEIKSFLREMGKTDIVKKSADVNVIGKFLKKSIDGSMETLYEEDLAAIQRIDEKEILYLLERHLENGQFYSFIGDILVFLNPNENLNIYGGEFHPKYQQRSRSDNAPHIYSVADVTIQNAFHHCLPQQIVLFGETGSGKTTNYFHLMDQLFFLGDNPSINSNRIKDSIKLLHSMIHASTPWNENSTRAVFRTEVSFGKSGKLSGANFKVNCLEKWRISSSDMSQGSFNFIHYVKDGIASRGLCETYKLEAENNYKFLRPGNETANTPSLMRNKKNSEKFNRLTNTMSELEFTGDQISFVYSLVAAILNLGEINFGETEDGHAAIENKEIVENVAELLEVDSKKLSWALTNYCIVKNGKAIRKRNSINEALDSRDVLANTLYARMVNYIAEEINSKLSVGKQIFGSKYSIKVLDYFGFECFKKNSYFQLLVNCFNEQMHYHYLQRVFAWEMVDLQNEEVDCSAIHYYNNKDTLNELLGKPDGLFSLIDDASKRGLSGRYITDNLCSQETHRIRIQDTAKFSVAHYTGRVTYDCKTMPEKNRDYLAPEIIETIRGSENLIISKLFLNKLDKIGNLISADDLRSTKFRYMSKVGKIKQYSQTKKMRTQAMIFRSFCIDLLKELSVGSGMGGTYFVKCIRIDLKNRPRFFHKELVRQQIRAMAISETALLRKMGYSQRIPFHEFLRRFKFLAFDFDENVEMTGDNCRLLMIRLHMEGWLLGKTKIFLKYYNEEYLSRLYETQVRKIIKIQSILRRFLVQCQLAKKIKKQEESCVKEMNRNRKPSIMTEEEAAEVIQKAYRNITRKKEILETFKPLKEEQIDFIKPFVLKWKNNSIFSVLMRYRGITLQDFFNFSQQVHLFNMNAFHNIQIIGEIVYPEVVETKATVSSWLGPLKPSIFKIQFRLDDIPYYDNSNIHDYFSNVGSISDRESWDTPYKWRDAKADSRDSDFEKCSEDDLVNIEYHRDPDEPLMELPETEKLNEKHLENEKIFTKNPKVGKTMKFSESRNNSQTEKRESKTIENEVNFNRNPMPHQSVQLRKVQSMEFKPVGMETYKSTSPANKDFEYIKAKPVTVKPKYAIDPIAELKNMPRKESTASDDDPPFNFQAMLRKTNIRRDSRDSIRNALQAVRRFSLSTNDDSSVVRNGVSGDGPIESKLVSMEISPGVYIEGHEVEL